MARISGTIVPSLTYQSTPEAPALEVGPSSRIVVQLLDVSLMDAPSVTLGEDVILTGDHESSKFPIPFSLTYNADNIQSFQSLALAVRVYDVSRPSDGDDRELTWISTSRHSVITNGNPTNHVAVEIEPVPKNDDTPITPKNTLTGHITASTSVPASSSHGIGPNAKILIQLLDTSLADAPSVTIAEQRIILGVDEISPFPIPFGIPYDPKDIDDRNVYSVSVRAEELNSEKLLWISTWANHVLTRDAPSENVEIEVDLIQ
ncbi:hypothetical protein BGZ95_001022 [Linnemannia exigua]|uniref:Uncharacterized protein n=1 Tax=Linnemannia exigua TaxID=604196 RepID=A0AAD4H9S2_9FUNG|nr:hypothetical protein BGZ95_001022 [Linnemannia exigua]